jgi:TonB family protein
MSEAMHHNINMMYSGSRAGAKRGLLAQRGLLDIVPHPPGADREKLEQIAAHHRVLILRGGAVIAITTVISVGGALLIHALAAGVLVIGFWFPAWVGFHPGGKSNLAGPPDTGGSAGGFSILGDGPDANAPPAPQLAEIFGNSPSGAGGLPAHLPVLPESTPSPTAARLAATAEPLPVVSGDLGSVMIVGVAAAPALPEGLAVAPPTAVVTGPADQTGGGIRGQPARGTGEGDGGGDADRIFPLLKGDGTGGPGGGGRGTGSGGGRGSGIDRGMSAADKKAQQLDTGPGFSLPPPLQMKPPEKDVTVKVHIGADGNITDVTVVESSGIKEVDQAACDCVKAFFKYSPAYKSGKPVPFDDFVTFTKDPL